MGALNGIIAFMILTIIIGKHIRRPTILTYIIVVLIAIAQVAFVLYVMFTLPYPTT